MDKIEPKVEDEKKDVTTSQADKDAMAKDGTGKDADSKNTEARKIGSFPGDLSTIRPIFSMKSKNQQAKERFS